MIKLFLCDIEGTTTDIHFVHEVLFPYSYEALENFVLNNQTNPTILKAIEDTRKTVEMEENKNIGLKEVISKLKSWIKSDRKHPALKEVQGLIWEYGYKKGDFKGHVYEDVKPFFQKVSNKAKLGIYSSGSVHAQKLIFGHSVDGDLNPMISYYFDTKVGGKRDRSSYLKISQETNLRPEEIHFFSDIPEELEAAHACGFKVTQLVRPGTKPSSFNGIPDFSEIF